LNVYVDTSFLASHYLIDAHSSEADRRMARHPLAYLTPFHRAEMMHVVNQQVFRGNIPLQKAELCWRDFEQDCLTGIWADVNLPEKSFTRCIEIARNHVATLGVRTLDSLHVACALELRAQRFWTFDDRQARLAEAVGLDTTA
jgi:predicted nucleic acid-binding protein